MWYAWFFQIPRFPEYSLSRKDNQGAINSLIGTSKPDAFKPAEIELYRQAFAQPQAIRSMLNWYRALIQRRRPAPADWRLHIPTIVLWGKEDHHILKHLAKESIALCDDGQLVIVPNGTHWVHHEAPQLVNLFLTNFLAGKPAQPPAPSEQMEPEPTTL
jgi:pimeloyl-ACP methyl ester carboxylesterase